LKRPEQHRIGELGELQTAEAFVHAGWIVQKLSSDYGFDLLIQRVEGEKVTGDLALIQVKATGRLSPGELPSESNISIDPRHQELWDSTPVPTFLVLVDVNDQRLFATPCGKWLPTARKNDGTGVDEGRARLKQGQWALLSSTHQFNEISTSVATYWNSFRAAVFLGEGARFLPGLGAVAGPTASFLLLRRLLHLNVSLARVAGEEAANRVTLDIMRSFPGQDKSVARSAVPNPTTPDGPSPPLSGFDGR
jgi:hypothetical protein